MSTFRASYFDGRSSRAHAVEVRRLGSGRIHVWGDGIDRVENTSALHISAPLARIARTIEFADGARLLAGHDDLPEPWFPGGDRLQRVVDRLERHAHAVAGSIVVCLAMGFGTFFWGVPWLSDRIAAQVPERVETALGEEVLGQLDRFFGFAASKVERLRQDELSARFAGLVAGLPRSAHYRLAFRDAPEVGPNALAVPGGTVVVTDQLVELLEDDREFDAVVAHELGHQQHRHALRQTLRSSFVLVIAALFTGDVSSASGIVIAVPAFLLQSHYSRGFEEEADAFAFSTLAAHATSPAWFAAAMRKLDDHYGETGEEDDGPAYLSSHPRSVARIAAAEAAGDAFIAAHPELVRETPDYNACEDEGICPEEDEDDGDCDDCDDEDYFNTDAIDEGSDDEVTQEPAAT